MKIILSPIAASETDNLPSVKNDVLSYRGESYDLTQLPDGATVEAEAPFVGSITRKVGQVELTLQYQYNSQLAEPMQATDWESYTFNVTDGICPDPIKWKPEPEVLPTLPQVEETENDN
jgi:hypothetical protein